MKNICLFSVFSLLILMSAHAQAQMLSGPSITKGERKFEQSSTITNDDGDITVDSNVEYKHSFTDKISAALEAEFKKRQDDSVEFEATELKVNYQLTGKEAFMVSGIRAFYKMDHLGDEDNIGTKIMLQKSYGSIRHRANIEFGHEVGEKSRHGVSAEAGFGSFYKFDGYMVGGEYLVDFGKLRDKLDYEEQEHQIGPYFEFSFPVAQQKVKMKTAYYAGVSSAADDSTFKYKLEMKF